MIVRSILAVAAALFILAGCSGPTTGTPTPASTSATSAQPVRPKELNLTGKESCLVPQADWATFFIEKNGKVTNYDEEPKGIECFYSTNVGGFGLLLNTTDGIKYWTDTPSSEKVDKVAPVQGFPTLERAGGIDKQRCDLIVDVADGQALVAFATILPSSASKLPPKCEVARQLADIAITALNR